MAHTGEGPAEQVHRVAGAIARYLTRYDAEHDPRAVFAYTYLRLTTSLESSLQSKSPSFRSPTWVADLAETLASHYFAAMDGIDAWLATSGVRAGASLQSADLPEVIPKPWRDVYVATTSGRSYVLEDVLFAMMAHISYDLPLALQRMPQPTDGTSHIDDFHTMNSVLGGVIDLVQQEVASRYSYGLAILDRLLAREDEIMSNYGIRLSRGMAWYNSVRLRDPDAASAATHSINNSTAAFIQEVRTPADWRLRLALGIARPLVPACRRWPVAEHPAETAGQAVRSSNSARPTSGNGGQHASDDTVQPPA